MATKAALEKRISNLESAGEEEKRTVIFVEYDGTPSGDRTDTIIHKCEACCDKKTYEKALGAAFVEITGKNPLESEDATAFIIIGKEIALKTVQNLKAAGVSL